ncbi:hypothetical protein HYPSUDRAFT_663800 [Hypholoma sublateritium FD-334 SS-4]|uniref:Uncharacterized protein n=1 Tax=Hypholoma sublateritium (strain FD-334 SS-4) TaxID=945553 RepID=A0A0D2NT99_HYPSF|nr:hypothetical protein HYPSUDRAFT_663800 [Hypholoma sublateritium FD-334 SS-4]
MQARRPQRRRLEKPAWTARPHRYLRLTYVVPWACSLFPATRTTILRPNLQLQQPIHKLATQPPPAAQSISAGPAGRLRFTSSSMFPDVYLYIDDGPGPRRASSFHLLRSTQRPQPQAKLMVLCAASALSAALPRAGATEYNHITIVTASGRLRCSFAGCSFSQYPPFVPLRLSAPVPPSHPPTILPSDISERAPFTRQPIVSLSPDTHLARRSARRTMYSHTRVLASLLENHHPRRPHARPVPPLLTLPSIENTGLAPPFISMDRASRARARGRRATAHQQGRQCDSPLLACLPSHARAPSLTTWSLGSARTFTRRASRIPCAHADGRALIPYAS